ncbi:MAG TPA: pyruvate, phosphate dikinase [Armatimonadota bacterium]|jgi:pyruvate,orthophosphate dikinase
MASPESKRVWLFAEGNQTMRDLLGGKGANLAEMTNIGLPVPPGFTITTAVCNEYTELGRLPDGLMDEVKEKLANVEAAMGKELGDASNPLLVSVRSGAKFSMPGMMDTILNLGLNDTTAEAIIKLTDNPRFVYDAYRRFIMMFSDVVLSDENDPKLKNLRKREFEHVFDALKKEVGASSDTEVDAAGLKKLVGLYKEHFKANYGSEFPSDPMKQLELAIEAVFKSWNNPRAFTYRNVEKIAHDLGTAVNVQSMVFGNMGNDSGTGVAFTRDPATGENVIFGEFLMNAQGEDVVAGVRTPEPIAALEARNPEIYKQFCQIAQTLESHYREVQDLEFTIEKGRFFILQCRTGKRTGTAAVKIAVDLTNEGVITKEEAVLRVPPEQLEQLLHPRLDRNDLKTAIKLAKGLNAGPGAASGVICLSSKDAAKRGNVEHGGDGEAIILVRKETNPDDLAGMLAAKGVLTAEGGRTSHAALVARQFGIPTICGCSEMQIDLQSRSISFPGKNGDRVVLKEGDHITLDGTDGSIYSGLVKTEPPAIAGEFGTFMGWADEFRRLGVRANADTPDQASEALGFGAEGIGLCRTEHMFLEASRLPIVRDMILAENDAERQVALDRLLPMQRNDFLGIFEAMGDKPVTVRLIDPPLHEFLPKPADLLVEVTTLKIKDPNSPELKAKEDLLAAVEGMHEANPMLGLRGCRLSIVFPQIVNMQVSAIIGAACQLKKAGQNPHPEIMVPLIGHVNELIWVKNQLVQVAEDTMKAEGVNVEYTIGTMIEVPRAALTAGPIAKEAAFFSFGTNDLTQMAYGISRDDAGRFLRLYVDNKIFPGDPTESIDPDGVGRLMQICVDDAKKVNPKIKLGICGEHGGDPSSVTFCHNIGLTYVSCSPKRVPVARLAAAQANIKSDYSRDK